MNLNSQIESINTLEIYPNSEVAKKAYLAFKEQLLSSRIDSLNRINRIKSLNAEIFQLISELQLSKLFITITNSDSIFYRFAVHNTKSRYEFKFEVFFDCDNNDESEIESILHIYNDNTKESAHYGTVEYLYDIILTKIYAPQEVPNYYYTIAYPMPAIKISEYSGSVSPALIAYNQ